MRNTWTIFRRELASYFATPLAYVFIVIFLVMAGMLTFFLGNFFDRGQADLQPFFSFHPWLYLVLIPALVDAALGRGAQDRHDRAVPDPADPDDRGGGRKVPRGLGFCRHRAGPDLSVLDHRQPPRATPTTA